MRRSLERVMADYGTDMTILREGSSRSLRGFFRAVNSKSWQSMENEATFLGEISRGQYAYLGPAGGDLREGDTIVLGQKQYLVRRTELYYYRNQALYQWGLCVEKGVNDTWGSRS